MKNHEEERKGKCSIREHCEHLCVEKKREAEKEKERENEEKLPKNTKKQRRRKHTRTQFIFFFVICSSFLFAALSSSESLHLVELLYIHSY